MKGRAIKAPVKPNGKGGGVVPKLLPPKLVAPKRNPSMIIKNSPPAGEGGEGSSGRRETEIHRTGPMGEVNILRLDSNGETMMLEVRLLSYAGALECAYCLFPEERGGGSSTVVLELVRDRLQGGIACTSLAALLACDQPPRNPPSCPDRNSWCASSPCRKGT